MRIIKYSQALSEGLVQAMERDPNIFMTGIAEKSSADTVCHDNDGIVGDLV